MSALGGGGVGGGNECFGDSRHQQTRGDSKNYL